MLSEWMHLNICCTLNSLPDETILGKMVLKMYKSCKQSILKHHFTPYPSMYRPLKRIFIIYTSRTYTQCIFLKID